MEMTVFNIHYGLMSTTRSSLMGRELGTGKARKSDRDCQYISHCKLYLIPTAFDVTQ